jgi:putative transposase
MWMPNYRRNFVPGGTFFFTVALLERKRDLLVSEIDLLRKSVRRVKGLYPFEINAWVVLPDHLHCIWTLPEGDGDFATRWRLIKLLLAKGATQGRAPFRSTQKAGRTWHLASPVLGTHDPR